jgi:hypothetical protein
MNIKERILLNKITHSVRTAQVVLQYGVGAMIDFPDQTLVTAAPTYWQNSVRVYDDRLAKALGVDHFVTPKIVSYNRFPSWYFCPGCRKFQTLKQWEDDYNRKVRAKKRQDPYMIKNMRCPECNLELVVSRIVTICEKGHLNDFPWVEWVHRNRICSNPRLKIRHSANTESLGGIIISCDCCGEKTTLEGPFNSKNISCEGNHPFKHKKEKCECVVKVVQRGASSVYFPLVYSSLVIPPYADYINIKIEKSKTFHDCITIVSDYDGNLKEEFIKSKLDKWSEKVSQETGISISDAKSVLYRKFLGSDEFANDITDVKYKFKEYQALNGSTPSFAKNEVGDFLREEMDVSKYNIPHIKSISLIDKVRVVKALVGFSRVAPVSSKNDPGFVEIKERKDNWYPAYEVRGEGIFIEFLQKDIENWIGDFPEILARCERLQQNYDSSFIGKNHPKLITPKFIMLHTLSNLLISQLSFECGYSIASLAERLYFSDEGNDVNMAGIFIYTASGDSEGTLGGLVRQGRPDTFPRIFAKALRKAVTCSNDPVCIMSKGQGRDSLNLAACHACSLLPETCCEERNSFLDRGLIVGTFDNKKIGFWNDYLQNIKSK